MRHVRFVVALAILAAVAIGFLLPNPFDAKDPVSVSQVPSIKLN